MQSKKRMSNDDLMQRGWQAMESRLDNELPISSKYDEISKLGLSLLLLLISQLGMHQHDTPSLALANDEEPKIAVAVQSAPIIETEYTEIARVNTDASLVPASPPTKYQTNTTKEQADFSLINTTATLDIPQQAVNIDNHVKQSTILSTTKSTTPQPIKLATSIEQLSNTPLDSLEGIVSVNLLPSYLVTTESNQYSTPNEPTYPNLSKWTCYIGAGGLYSQSRQRLGTRFNLGVNQQLTASKWSLSYELAFQNFTYTTSDSDGLALAISDKEDEVNGGVFEPNESSTDVDNSIRSANNLKQNQIALSLIPHFKISSSCSFGIGPSVLYLTDAIRSDITPTLESRFNVRLNRQLALHTFWQQGLSREPKNIGQYGLTLNYIFN